MREAKRLHAQIMVLGLSHQEPFLRKLLSLYCAPNCSSLDDACLLFDRIQHPSTFLYNTIIRACAATLNSLQSYHFYQRMRRRGSPPDHYTFPFLLKACSSIGDVVKGEEIQGQALRFGFGCDVFVQNSLIHLYGLNGRIEMANRVFDEMGYRDVATWTSLITCYVNCPKIELARKVFDQMPVKTDVSYSAMITGYMKVSCFEEVLQLFREMLMVKVEPNDSTIMSVLCACANLGALDMGRWVFSYICPKIGMQFDTRITTALIDMFFKCGSIEKALQIFHGATEKHVGEWTAVISGFAMHGLGEPLIEAFEGMISSGVKPNAVTFVSLLSGCTHGGLVNKGLYYFYKMKEDFGISPSLEHYGCVVDLLGKAGLIDQAIELIKDMPFRVNAVIWGSLLNACRVHKNVEVGEVAAGWLINDEPWNGALYMTLMGLYSDADKRVEVEKVKNEMKKVGCRKNPGCSLILIDGVSYEFVVGDNSKPCALELCSSLGKTIAKYLEYDYIPPSKMIGSFELHST